MESQQEAVIAVLGDYGPSLSNLSELVRELGHHTVRAKTPLQVIELARNRKLHFSAALLNPLIASTKLSRVLSEVRRRTQSPNLVFLAAGERPRALASARLREAGVELALWDTVSDHDLRFQLNRATSGWAYNQLRGEFRAPTDWTTQVFSNGREKPADIYTFSGSGAFLATPRPSLTGADLTLELPLPSGPVRVSGEVVYTNVPGNRRRSQLPNGMAVQFHDPPPAVANAIRDSVAAKTLDLTV